MARCSARGRTACAQVRCPPSAYREPSRNRGDLRAAADLLVHALTTFAAVQDRLATAELLQTVGGVLGDAAEFASVALLVGASDALPAEARARLSPVYWRAGTKEVERARAAILTLREREVASLIAAGHTTREVAESLVTTQATVRRHVANILSKLGVHTHALSPGMGELARPGSAITERLVNRLVAYQAAVKARHAHHRGRALAPCRVAAAMHSELKGTCIASGSVGHRRR